MHTPQGRAINMADIGKKVKGAATKAAKDKVSGEKKGKGTGGSKSDVDKAEKALKNRLK
jgi:biotin operon repressor